MFFEYDDHDLAALLRRLLRNGGEVWVTDDEVATTFDVRSLFRAEAEGLTTREPGAAEGVHTAIRLSPKGYEALGLVPPLGFIARCQRLLLPMFGRKRRVEAS